MIGIYNQVRKDLEVVRKQIKDWANKKRKNPPAFIVGQLVMLNACNIYLFIYLLYTVLSLRGLSGAAILGLKETAPADQAG